ncbi:MAG: S8 family serine peptidase [Candidatus Aquicultorales bacterium]
MTFETRRLRSLVSACLVVILIGRTGSAYALPAGIQPNGIQPNNINTSSHDPTNPRGERVQTDIVIKYKPGVTEAQVAADLASENCSQIDFVNDLELRLVQIPSGIEPEEMCDRFRSNHPLVQYVECNYIRRAFAVPNDPYYVQNFQWGPKRIGAETAWDTTTGSPGTVIAVVDSGVDYTTTELPLGTKVILGWDFVNDDPDPMDEVGHGTLVAGTASALTNNAFGIAGMAWNPKILAVKVLDNQLLTNDFIVVEGIDFAADQGADIINLSLGDPEPSAALDDAVVSARSKGSVVIGAGGNDANNDTYYPAGSPGAVDVASIRNTARYEEVSATRSGTWLRSINPQYSGETALYSSVTGSSLTFTYTGTSFYVVGTGKPNGGVANVYVDGVFQRQWELYYPFDLYTAKVAYGIDMPFGTHTVRIEVSGLKNAQSSGFEINIDAFDFDRGSETQSDFTNFGPAIDIAAPGENIWVNFLNNQFFLVQGTSLSAPMTSGVAALVKAQHPTLTNDQISRFVIESSTDLNPANHSEAYGYGILNAAAPVSNTMSSVEETSPAIAYGGTWTNISAGGASAFAYNLAGTGGETAAFPFNGTSINWVTLKGPSQGIASVELDGVPQGNVDLYQANFNWQSIGFRKNGLSPGAHTLEITVTGTKNAASSGTDVVVDAFDVLTSSDATPPTAPAGLTQTRTDYNVNLNWTASTGGDGYAVERSLDQVTWQPVGVSIPPGFIDEILPHDQAKTWFYRVRAFDRFNNRSAYSNTVSLFMPDITPPTDPSNFQASLIGTSFASLSWTASTDNVAVTGYRIEKAHSAAGPWNFLVNTTATDYLDPLSPADIGKVVFYRVRAFDAAGNNSNYVTTGLPTAYIVNDATGDGLSDGIAFYDYGRATAAAWVFKTVPSLSNALGITFAPETWWPSPFGSYDLKQTKMVTGDFNGDFKADVMSLYNYGGATSGLWLFTSSGTAFSSPSNTFFSTAWSWGNSKPVTGDFNADGRDDLVIFYRYARTTTGAFLFTSRADGSLNSPQSIFFSTAWDWSQTRLLSARDGAGSKIVAVYDYGGTTMGLWVFKFNPDGTLQNPTLAFRSTQWSVSRSSFITGDLDGDGQADVIAFYNYGGTTTGAFVFESTGTSFAPPRRVFLSNQWDFSKSTFIPGDFNGDGRDDAGAIYFYGGTTTGGFVFASDGINLLPVNIYSSPGWFNPSSRWLMPY